MSEEQMSAEPTQEVSAESTEAANPVETTEQQTQVESQGEPQEYTPDFGYKVQDQQYEMEEWARNFIKDKDTEDKFRDLFTKSYGLDEVKKNRDELRGQYDEVSGQYRELTDSIDILRGHVQNKDYESFFKSLGISKQEVQQWMYQDLQRGQMPPEQQQQYDQRLDAMRRATELERQNQELTQQTEEMQRQHQEMELSRVLQTPEVNTFMQSYDARMGQVGAFRDKVVAYAVGQFHATGRDLSAQEAINEIMSFTQPSMQQSQGAGAPQGQPQVVAPQQKPTIPNIQGRNSSPVRKVPKSIEELRQQVHDRYGNE